MKPFKTLAALAASSLLLAGCTLDSSVLIPEGSSESTAPTTGAGTSIDAQMPAIPDGLESYYTQDVDWDTCNGSFQCAEITVPLDYANPDGDTIQVAMLKRPAKSEAIGTLFINPGGPGGSGIDMAMSASYYFDQDILDNFDVVGFDPRGVGESTAIDCLDDATLGSVLDSSFDTNDPDWQAEYTAVQRTIADGCAEKSGELIKFVGTKEAAQDLDVMRELVGDPKLYYVGYSYGTALGGQYADLFPENVGRVILDGAVDTTLGTAQMSYDQTLGFETALRHYMEDCLQSSSCPFTGSVDDGLQQIHDALTTAMTTPYPTSDPDRPLTQSLLFSGLIVPLYDDSTWSMLTTALSELFEGNDGSQLLYFADLSSDRNDDGTFASNINEANWAINCADYPAASESDLEAVSEKLNTEAPVFGSLMTEGTDLCASWHFSPTDVPGAFEASGSDPIVVVGTLYDPATPYAWAEAVAQALENSVLVTWEGEGHTAYGRAGSCINDPLDQYLLQGTVPEDGLTCSS